MSLSLRRKSEWVEVVCVFSPVFRIEVEGLDVDYNGQVIWKIDSVYVGGVCAATSNRTIQ